MNPIARGQILAIFDYVHLPENSCWYPHITKSGEVRIENDFIAITPDPYNLRLRELMRKACGVEAHGQVALEVIEGVRVFIGVLYHLFQDWLAEKEAKKLMAL